MSHPPTDRPRPVLNRRQAVALAASGVAGFAGPASAAEFSPPPVAGRLLDAPKAPVPFDLPTLKRNWRKRIDAMRQAGVLPLIDIESNPGENFDLHELARAMDREGVALIAWSGHARGRGWSDAARHAVGADPWRYVPTGDGGLPPEWRLNPVRFAATSIEKARTEGYPLLGEYEFRHYPSPDEIERGLADRRQEHLALDSEAAHMLFRFSEETGISFQIHQEIEDVLLPPLEKMLAQYPKARVIWCHLAQMRFQDRNTVYGPDYVRKLIERFPGLYFDLWVGGPNHRYPVGNEFPGRYWNPLTGRVRPEWVSLIADHPWRFLAALDLNPAIMDTFSRKVGVQRQVIEQLPEPVREIVAWKAAWKLVFNEEA